MPATARTLRASPDAQDALTAKQLLDAIDVQSRKIEDNPRLLGGYRGLVNRARRSVKDRRFNDARSELDDLIAHIATTEDEASTQAALQAQETHHAEVRGEETITADSGHKSRDGYLWLRAKGKIVGPRANAGDAVRKYFAQADASPKSCLSGDAGGGFNAGSGPSDEYSRARFELDCLKDHIKTAVGSQRASYLYSLLEAVCGRGETVRAITGNDGREGDRVVTELQCALDMTAAKFGLVRV